MATRTDPAATVAATDNPASRDETVPAARTDHPEYWQARGIGSEWDLTCLVTGEQLRLMPNVSGFVRSREAGERVVALFGGRARLDFRSFDTDWCQVKVGVIEEHREVLERLDRASWACDGRIDAKMIAWALDPIGSRGWEPAGLRALTESRSRIVELETALKATAAPVATVLPDPAAKALSAAIDALRSYQHGNTAPDLAREIADYCESILQGRPT